MTTDRLRVLQITDALSVGGKERVAVDLANGLAQIGCDSRILCGRTPGTLADDLSDDVKLWCAERGKRLDLGGIRRSAAYIDENRVDVVHSHNPSSSYFTRVVLWFAKTRPVHVVHDHHGPGLHSRKVGFLTWLMLRHVDAYVAVSQELRDRASRLLPLSKDRCLYFRNGIRIPPPAPRFDGRPTVIQVANLHGTKDHADAMRAAARLRERIGDLRWRCVGRIADRQAPYVREVLDLIDSLGLADCVELTGARSDVHELLKEAHVGVLTSSAEALPVSVLEYMAASLPVVVTDTGQAPAIVREADAGRVVPVKDPDRMADSIYELLGQADLGARCGRNGREHVAAHYSVDRVVEDFFCLYRRLLARRGGRR